MFLLNCGGIGTLLLSRPFSVSNHFYIFFSVFDIVGWPTSCFFKNGSSLHIFFMCFVSFSVTFIHSSLYHLALFFFFLSMRSCITFSTVLFSRVLCCLSCLCLVMLRLFLFQNFHLHRFVFIFRCLTVSVLV